MVGPAGKVGGGVQDGEPDHCHSWKNAQTRLCYFSGLLCNFLPVDTQLLLVLHFAVKFTYKMGE